MLLTHASVWGHTNDTHAGLYDIALLANIPNLVYLAPTNCEEYISMLDWSINQDKIPVAIRIPWTKVYHVYKEFRNEYFDTKYEVTRSGSKVAIIALGSFYQLGEEIVDILANHGIKATLINPMFISGIDNETLDSLKNTHELVVTLEDGILNGGFGAKIAQYYGLSHMKVMNKGFSMNIPNRFAPEKLMIDNRLLPSQVVQDILANVRGEKA